LFLVILDNDYYYKNCFSLTNLKILIIFLHTMNPTVSVVYSNNPRKTINYKSYQEIKNYDDVIEIHFNGLNLCDDSFELPNLPKSLKTLFCREGKLKKLPQLPETLEELFCSMNKLESLPKLPNSLVKLYCDTNQLRNLPDIPNSLKQLYCGDNQLTSLPNLPESLIIINCELNKIKTLDKLPSNLEYFYCQFNRLIQLKALPKSLKEINCSYNQLFVFPEISSTLNIIKSINLYIQEYKHIKFFNENPRNNNNFIQLQRYTYFSKIYLL